MTDTTEKEVSRFREALPQVLASSANNFFRMNVSLSLGFATVVIAQLHHADDPLSLDDTSASWLGSIAYICQPLGSVASGVIVELIGRKKFLIALNIPFLIGLILLCTAPSYAVLLLANVIIGITVGLTEAPNNSYNGEVCQPELRGAMSANSGIFYQLGFFMQFLLGSLTHWRTAAAISTVIPIATFICVSLIPEVPIWLISRGRNLEAEKALRWLRGWVSPSAVQKELSELVRYHEDTKLGKKKVKDSPQPSAQSHRSNTSPEIVHNTSNQLETINPNITNNENQSEPYVSTSEAVNGIENQSGSEHLTHDNINTSETDRTSLTQATANRSQNEITVPKIVINDKLVCTPMGVNNATEYSNTPLPETNLGATKLNKELSESMIRNEIMSNNNRNLTIANSAFVTEKCEQPAFEGKESTDPTGFQVVGVLRDLFRPPTLRPLLLVVPFFFFVHFAGLTSIRPYMVLVFRELQMPISAEWFTVVSGGCGLLGSILLMVFVRLLGKRIISLVGTALSAGAALILGVYAYVRPEDEGGMVTYTWIPLVLIVTLSFCNSIVEQIPSILISEVYPFRTRGLSVGISVAFCYFFIFLATKTYLDIEKLMNLYGAFWFYGIISCMGYIYFHFFLLETEGKTLEEIEHHFTEGISALSKIGRKKGKKDSIISTHL